VSEDSDELLTGRIGNEAAAGYTQMPGPAEQPDELDTESPTYKHLTRPEDPLFEVEREYHDPATGKPRDKYEAVPLERVADDLAAARRQERQDLEAERNRELDEALRAHEAGREPQQPAHQDQQPTALDELQSETPEAEAARVEVDAAWQRADEQITEFLKDPHIRERIQGEYDQIKQQAAAEAKAEVERAHALSSAVRDHYQQSTNNLANEANALVAALYPELDGLNAQQVQGALKMMAQNQPERVQALSRLASRAQGVMEAQQRQQYEQQRGFELQREAALEQYSKAQVGEYEKWTAKENPETLKAIRENLSPIVEKQYGVPMQTLMAIYSGKMQMDATTFVRSAAFQKMLHDSIKYNLAARAVTQARTAVVPNVQRPGANVEPRGDDSSYATLERSLRGQSLNPKQAADLLIAHRARR
jgi:hypothetical protein